MKAKQSGFTLLEMMVTVGIAALLLGLGIPALTDFIRNSRITAAANDLLVDLNLARTEAVKRRGSVTLCRSTNASAADVPATPVPSCGDGRGWIVFEDLNANGDRDGGETLLQAHGTIPDSIKVASLTDLSDTSSAALSYVMYAPSGFRRVGTAEITSDSGVLFCDARRLDRTVGSGATAQYPGARLIEISGPGRALITRSVGRIGTGGLNLSCPTT